jgi:hypothetical protein
VSRATGGVMIAGKGGWGVSCVMKALPPVGAWLECVRRHQLRVLGGRRGGEGGSVWSPKKMWGFECCEGEGWVSREGTPAVSRRCRQLGRGSNASVETSLECCGEGRGVAVRSGWARALDPLASCARGICHSIFSLELSPILRRILTGF